MKRGFYQHSRAWYREAAPLPDGVLEEFMIGLYAEEGGTKGEFALRLYKIGRDDLVFRLEAYGDSWPVLFGEFLDLVDWLKRHGSSIGTLSSPAEDMRKILEWTLGIEDLTDEEGPVAPDRKCPACGQRLVDTLKGDDHG